MNMYSDMRYGPTRSLDPRLRGDDTMEAKDGGAGVTGGRAGVTEGSAGMPLLFRHPRLFPSFPRKRESRRIYPFFSVIPAYPRHSRGGGNPDGHDKGL